jgi:hypothetical protein
VEGVGGNADAPCLSGFWSPTRLGVGLWRWVVFTWTTRSLQGTVRQRFLPLRHLREYLGALILLRRWYHAPKNEAVQRASATLGGKDESVQQVVPVLPA